jgi:uncharacterized membrane protein
VSPLRAATAVLALAGIGIAGYLTWVHYAGLEPVCVGGGGGCEQVQASRWAELAGIPVALLGLIAYATILASLALPDELGRSVAAFVSLVGFAFSAWLTYVELEKINAVCQWCVASAVVITALAAVSLARLMRAEPEPARRPGRAAPPPGRPTRPPPPPSGTRRSAR